VLLIFRKIPLKFLKCKDTKERSVLIDSATRLLKDADKDNINAWQKELSEYLDKELSVEEEYSLVHALLMISFYEMREHMEARAT
jgi:hypothetical protein